MPIELMFDRMPKNGHAASKWSGLSCEMRRLVAFRFFEILLGSELRRCIEWRPEQVVNGHRLAIFAVMMGFGKFVFAMSLRGGNGLVDLYVDMAFGRRGAGTREHAAVKLVGSPAP